MKIKLLNDGTYAQLIDYNFPIIIDCAAINDNNRAFVKAENWDLTVMHSLNF